MNGINTRYYAGNTKNGETNESKDQQHTYPSGWYNLEMPSYHYKISNDKYLAVHRPRYVNTFTWKMFFILCPFPSSRLAQADLLNFKDGLALARCPCPNNSSDLVRTWHGTLYRRLHTNNYQWPLLLKRFIFNTSMDK